MEEKVKNEKESLIKLDIPDKNGIENPENNYSPLSMKEKLCKNLLKILLIIFFLILIFIIILLLYFILKKEVKNSKNTTTCNIGKEEKCLSCDKTLCGSCNPGYKLINGTCLINYSFKAIYQSTLTNETIFFFNNFPLEDIDQMIIDGEYSSITNNYTFESIGQHSIYLLKFLNSSLYLIFF